MKPAIVDATKIAIQVRIFKAEPYVKSTSINLMAGTPS
jgi:hypothetical protein